MDVVPHVALSAHLECHRLDPELAAERWNVPVEVLHALQVGDYPDATAHYARIGAAIGVDPESWAWALAAGLCRLSREDAQCCLRGRLWRWLIREGLDVASAARRHSVTSRSLRLALSETAITASLRGSGILEAAGWDIQGGLHSQRRERNECAELRVLVAKAMATGSWTGRTLATEVGASRASIAALARGVVPRVINPVWVRSLGRALEIDPERFAHLLALTWRTRGSNRGAVRYLIMRHCFARGIPVAALAERLGVTSFRMRHLLAERCQPDEAIGAAIKRELGIDEETWSAALARHRARAQASSVSCDSLTTPPLHELVLAAAGAAGLDLRAWSVKNGLAPGVAERVVRWHRPPRLFCMRKGLCLALGIDSVVYGAAVRGMYETPRAGLDDYQQVTPQNRVQERLLGLALGSLAGMQRLARALRISQESCDRILRGGILDARSCVREKVRRYLGLDLQAFTREISEPASAMDATAVDDEVRLLRMFRSLPPERQKWLVGLAAGARS